MFDDEYKVKTWIEVCHTYKADSPEDAADKATDHFLVSPDNIAKIIDLGQFDMKHTVFQGNELMIEVVLEVNNKRTSCTH